MTTTQHDSAAAPASGVRPDVSVIIPHLNQVALLERCLRSIYDQTPPPNGFEVIVVDNGSSVPLESTLDRRAFPLVRLASEARPGPGPARSTGAAMARSSLLAFIDADCVAGPSWLCTIVGAFAADASLMVAGGDVRLMVEDERRFNAVEAYETIFAYRQRYYVEEVGFCATLNMAVRKSVFERVGPFGGIEIAEDRDWGRRAKAMGIPQTYLSNMLVYHPPRESLDELCRKWDRLLVHDYRDMVTGPIGRLRWLARAVAVGLSTGPHAAKVVTSDRLPNLESRLAGLAGLWRVRLHRTRRMLSLSLQAPEHVRPETWNR